MYMKIANTTKTANKEATSEEYTIDHSGTILMIDPKGNFYALFSTPHNVDSIVHDFKLIQANYRSD